jgi:hypothetical protein
VTLAVLLVVDVVEPGEMRETEPTPVQRAWLAGV